jgi:DNA polymerase
MNDPRADGLRYLERQLRMGRGRVVAPVAATAASPASEPPPAPEPAAVPAPRPSGRPPAAPSPPRIPLRGDEELRRIEAALAPIREKAAVCTRCDLAKTRTNVVFGCGTARSGIVFVGEAPGADEDAQGVPFVGRAGKLLDRILAAIGIARDDVYICNVLKCRPPGNRDPEPIEVASCAPYLVKQLEALEPRVLCALGLHAARVLLNTTAPMAKLRGQVFRYRGVPAIATYHPAAILRNPNLKPASWEDFQFLLKVASEAKPPKS